jgi:hypothetical protein
MQLSVTLRYLQPHIPLDSTKTELILWEQWRLNSKTEYTTSISLQFSVTSKRKN